MGNRGRKRRLLVWVAAIVVVTPIILFVLLNVAVRATLGPFENPPPPVKETSIESAYRRLYSNLKIRWNFELSEQDRVLHAACQGVGGSCWYLLQPGPDFDYEGLRTALLGELNDPSNQYRQVFVDDQDGRTSRGYGTLDWWRPSDLEDPDVIRIIGGTPENRGGIAWYFAISQEERVIYVSHSSAAWYISSQMLESAGIELPSPTP